MRAVLVQNMRENMRNLAKYALKYAANMQNMRHMRHINAASLKYAA